MATTSAGSGSQTDAYTLETKYVREEGRIFLSGVQALVRVPLDQHRADQRRGLRTAAYVSGYPGSPLGIVEGEFQRAHKLLKAHDVFFASGVNEELALTAAFGTQMLELFPRPKYDGVLGMWYGKGQGLDRSIDALKHANYAGVARNGGLLAVVGDDPNAKSSAAPWPGEVTFYAAAVPTVYPGTVQEILDLGLHAVALSRAAGLVVGVKIVTNLADSTGTAEVSPDRIQPIVPTVELDGRPYEHRFSLPYVMEMERTLYYARLELASRYARENRLNQIVVPTSDAWLGIVTSGKTYYDTRETLEALGLDEPSLRRLGIRILKLGLVYPVEPEIVREFARGLQEILVIEEKRPFLETFVKDILYGLSERPDVLGKSDEEGKPLVPMNAELDPDVIAPAIARRIGRKIDVESVKNRVHYLEERRRRTPAAKLSRVPFFCSGCPHNRSTRLPAGSLASPGIGCHAMAMWSNPQYVCLTQMGGEGAHWVGASPFTETPHLFQSLGDGTLFHSGSLAIRAAVAAGVHITFKILYNGTVAMTGGQQVAGVISVPALARELEAEGVKKIIITTDDLSKYRGVSLPSGVEVWHRDRLMESQEALAATPGVTALIHDQQCASEKRRLRRRGKLVDPPQRVFIVEQICEGCGDCSEKSNCLSLQMVETEFGLKTQVHQPSCNKDYSCLLGDCPSLVRVEPVDIVQAKKRHPAPLDGDLPEPMLKVPANGFTLRMTGIGGTGVVTVNQILGTAALFDGKHVSGLDQTGVAQKGGPVVSDLKVFDDSIDMSNKTLVGRADLYLALDVVVGTAPLNLATADPDRTVAVVSTSQVQTGQMVQDRSLRFPDMDEIRAEIDRFSRAADNVYLDARLISESLFDDHMPVNLIMIGVAYQIGALPISAVSIEQAIRLNGVSVEENVLAFRWGRMLVLDPARVEAAVQSAQRETTVETRPLSPQARALVDEVGADGELERLLSLRVPELIAYQNVAYAHEYVYFVRKVLDAERKCAPGRTALAESVARNLFKLMTYKDEYEVARLHLDALPEIKARFGPNVKIHWQLHPPALRALGRKNKISLGSWFTPGFGVLRSLRGLRGTSLDVFGRGDVRQVERALIGEYRQLMDTALGQLTADNYAVTIALADLPDEIRGFEQVKLESVARYREKARTLVAGLVGVSSGSPSTTK